MRISTLALLCLGLGLSIGACRGGDDDGDDSSGLPDGPPMDTMPSTDVRIQDIQSDSMPKGTAVTVKGVVVTAIDAFGTRTGDFFIQEPGGAAFSGVKVFGAPLDQVAMLVPGDLIDIAGAEKDEFALSSDTTGRKVTELKPVAGGMMTITKAGQGAMPTPVAVDAVAISMMDKAAREAEWEKWEGVLITVTNARQIAAQRSFGANVDQTEFRITGLARVQSVMTALPAVNAFGVCYERITGIGDYFFNDLVLPRTEADLVPSGTGCRPMATSIVALQSGTNTEVVDLANVVVIGRDDIGTTSKGFWVADAMQAAPNNGVLVYTRDAAAPADYVPGAVVNVKGAVEEFDLGSGGNPPMGDTLTEIVEPILSFVSAPAGLPVPLTVTADVVSNIGAPGEPYEGVLVRIATLKVTNINAGAGKVELTDNNGNKVIMDDDSFDWPDQVLNTCYSTVTGIMSVQITDNVRTINPRSAADFVVGVGCN